MYTVRFATRDELTQLPALERDAAKLFADSAYPQMVNAPLAANHLRDHDLIWVAATEVELAAFAIVREWRDYAHIQEIDVHSKHARRGIGRLLIEAIAGWAKTQKKRAVTLTTFDNVPWNGPYYARLGFETMELNSLPDELRDVRRAEQAAGLDMSHRICMQKLV